ncbi:ribosome hibernation-promoting factor, HPF/YfiA family [Aquimarina agarivorans]|uniref:ribosome hibernation-promoting factor, HPF/YfiA family n=1 Tax=Aquimarina agarivorans TaxID=980584 RepID=UPI000248E65B|nr:ribosome-associated translation inhibitor RaiA [Aquimarina agarivorans]
MKVNVQSVNFNVDQKLVSFTNEKLNKLEGHFNKIISAEVFMKVQNTSAKENKITEILLNIPGGEFVAKKTYKTFEQGVDQCLNSLERQLVKFKDKQKMRLV